MSRIFVSHSNELRNRRLTMAFCRWLDEEVGRGTYFSDYRDLMPGVEWDLALLRAIKRCETMVLLLSRAWFASAECRRELERATSEGKQVVPVLLESGLLEDARRFGLMRLQLCDLARGSAGADVDTDAPLAYDPAEALRLKQVLRREDFDPASFAWPPPGQDDRPPYPGLEPLTEADAGIFYGRTAALQEVFEQLRRALELPDPLVLVVQGDSGVGKSSFLRAGMLPRLARDHDRHAVVPVIRPATGLVEGPAGLLAAIAAFAGQAESPLSTQAVADRLAGDAHALERLLSALEERTRAPGAPPRTVVLAVDQAEELFDAQAAPTLARFRAHVGPLLQRGAGGPRDAHAPAFMLLLAIRSDHLHRLHTEELFQGARIEHYVLRPMAPAGYGDVIVRPALRAVDLPGALGIEPALVDRLARDAEGAADALPLLALTVSRLYQEARRGGATRLTLAQYDALLQGGGVVQWAVDQALADPQRAPPVPATPAAQARVFDGIFPLIATVDAASGEPRRLVASRDVWPAGSPADHILARLVDHHLLRQTADRGDATLRLVEVAHEALLRRWPLFTRWLGESRLKAGLIDIVQRNAAEWNRRGRERTALVERGARLSAALALQRDPHFGRRLQTDDRRYLQACRSRQRQQRLVTAAPATVVLALAPMMAWAWANALNLWTMFAAVPYVLEDAFGVLHSFTVPRTVTVPAAATPFDLGCKAGRDVSPGREDACPSDAEARRVTLAGVCELGRTEVTFFQYDYFVWWRRARGDPDRPYPEAPADGLRWDRPVVNVTIREAREYAAWLTARSAKWQWRLPTEAEWEYAARDTPDTGPYPWGAEAPQAGRANAVVDGHPAAPVEVGSFPPNARGLYDMAGNAAEWVESAVPGSLPDAGAIAKGGGWNQLPLFLRVAARDVYDVGDSASSVGFRVCRVRKAMAP